ncbi:MAG TPA: type I-U CRISPR-associated RAMP protein Csb1/Cas7u [Methanotrichaceae archaeon]|nr:type I-U CRISPR-associated RAMP protein Csb1/Cas7u [Methanotrichaceae archaeon]
MALNFSALNGVPRLLMEVELAPVQGDRFQPTGFADLGAAVYQRPDGTRMLLVESAQSVANRLEQTCLNGGGPRITSTLEGLPYILAKLTGNVETETSSLVEAHRINSPFIISDEKFKKSFKDKAGYSRGLPLNWRKIGAALFYFDPNSLLHGAFMANLEDGRVKVPRALTGFIEAEDIREAASGGVKNNPLDPTGKIRAEGYDKDVYGNVPYHRMEYTANHIRAYFNLDLGLLDGYGLEPEARNLLVALALYKVTRFLSSGLRLRTACDLKPRTSPIKVTEPQGFVIPDEKALLESVQENIKACAAKGLFVDPPVTEITTKVVLKEKKTEGEDSEGEGT